MTRSLLLFSVAGLLIVAGCRKDDIVNCAPSVPGSPGNPTSNLSLADFTRRNSVAPQVFTLRLDSSRSITTASGARLTFPASQFLLPNGTPATGTAQVRIREIYTVPDMLLANMPTDIARRGNMLVSGGEFNIQVWQNTTRLRLAPKTQVTSESPIPAAQDTTRQYVWKQSASVIASDTAGWQLASFQRVQSLPGLYRAILPLDSIGWWNIDQFWHVYSTASTTQVTIKTTATAFGETQVYMRPIGFNGLARPWPSNTPTTDWQRELPIGADMIAVVLQSINGQLYYGTQRVTISSGLIIKPVLTAVSEAEAVRLIRQL
jgi:hypothetical protein